MLGTLTFDELMIFGLQLTHYNRFDEINNKIKEFRKAKAKNEDSYRIFRGEILTKEILEIFDTDIKAGKTKVRESDDDSIRNFVKTKSRTMRDYADACVRYIRSTGHIKVSQRGRSLSIIPEKKKTLNLF